VLPIELDSLGCKRVAANKMAKILLVEDEIDLADTVKNWLEEEELNCVEHVCDGEDALRKLENRSYDLMILDLLLPRLAGLQKL